MEYSCIDFACRKHRSQCFERESFSTLCPGHDEAPETSVRVRCVIKCRQCWIGMQRVNRYHVPHLSLSPICPICPNRTKNGVGGFKILYLIDSEFRCLFRCCTPTRIRRLHFKTVLS